MAEKKEIKKLSRGIRKFVRGEKAKIRQTISNLAEQKQAIEALCKKVRV